MSAVADILDAHVHLYDPGAVRYDWMAAQPGLNAPHPPARYWAEAEAAGIATAVWVEVNAAPGEHLREAEHVAGWVGDDPRLVGMVASVPSDPVAGRIAETGRLDLMPQVVGVRTLIETHVHQPGWAASDAVVAEVDRITRRPGGKRRAFDLCIRAGQLSEAAELVARLPQVTFVLDHCGKPPIGDAAERAWRGDLSRLATRANCFCKLSGLGTEIVAGPVSADRTRPVLDHALEAFGPERCLFGSDWPICTLAFPLSEWVDTVAGVVAPAGQAALDAVFRDTARACYDIDRNEGQAEVSEAEAFKPDRIATRVWSLPHAMASGNFALVDLLDGRAMAVDTGTTTGDMARAEALAATLGLRLTVVLYTHHHYDHVLGGRGAQVATVYTHRQFPAAFDGARSQIAAYAKVPPRGVDGLDGIVHAPDRLLDPRPRQALPEEGIEVVASPGHCGDHLSVFLPGEGTLIAADAVVTAIPPAFPSLSSSDLDWLATLDRLAALGAETLLPGHGPVLRGAANVARWLGVQRAYLAGLHDVISALMDDGLPAEAIPPRLPAERHLPPELLASPHDPSGRHARTVARMIEMAVARRTAPEAPDRRTP